MTRKQSKLKVDLRPGSRLSDRFNNTRDCYKVVEDYVIGYVVYAGTRDAVGTVYPLFRAEIYAKIGKTTHVFEAHEQGDRLNGYTFHEDYEGCTFAQITAASLRALEDRRDVREREATALKELRRLEGGAKKSKTPRKARR